MSTLGQKNSGYHFDLFHPLKKHLYKFPFEALENKF